VGGGGHGLDVDWERGEGGLGLSGRELLRRYLDEVGRYRDEVVCVRVDARGYVCDTWLKRHG
jgi:hypothetical protein